MEKFVIVNDRVCRVISFQAFGSDHVEAIVAVGVREQKVSAGSRPSAGWMPDLSDPKRRTWLKYEDIREKMVLAHSALLSEYPIGVTKYGFTVDRLAQVLDSTVARAISVAGFSARHEVPPIDESLVTTIVRREGLPIPTEDERKQAIVRAWTARRPAAPRPKAVSINGRLIAPLPEKPPEGVVVPEGMFWSSALNRLVNDDADGKAAHDSAVKNGWPPDMLEGATISNRGKAGFSLAFTMATKFDKARFAAGTSDQPEAPIGDETGASPSSGSAPIRSVESDRAIIGEMIGHAPKS